MCTAEQFQGAYSTLTLILNWKPGVMISSKSAFRSAQQTTEARSQESHSDLQLVLGDIKKSLEGISSAFDVYSDCAEKLQEHPSLFATFQKDVDTFSKEIEEQERHQREVFSKITDGFEQDIRKQVELALGDRLSDVIQEEVKKIVQEEVNEQIEDHLPVSLKDQVEESTSQLEEIRISLENSRARIQNSFVEPIHLKDTLIPVLTLNGEKSPHYPQTMKRLFEYDLDKARALSKDYGLGDSEDVRSHFQQFLRHIGTGVDVVISDELESEVIELEEPDN